MLVGRESELSLLAERIEERRAIAVLGEAGVGKTALVRVAAERAGKRLHEAGALATLSWLPYLPLRRALGRDFAEGDAAYVASEVEHELGGGLLFLDDLHWADAQTRALLPLLVGRVALVGAIRRGDPATAAALEETAGAGLGLVPLEPLAAAEAAELAHLLHPDLSQAATERLVSRSGGNPFLLEQLAATGEPSESLQLAVAARLRLLSEAGREAMGLLALAGRPLELEVIGEAGSELVEAGLAEVSDGSVAVRHALLAETLSAELAEDGRRRLHARLARLLDDPGEAARHHAAAGEREQAFAKAMHAAEAATQPGVRAVHLGVAASVATGPEADDIRVRAAAALLETGRASEAEAVLADVEGIDKLLAARANLLHWHARLARHDVQGARKAWEEGIALAAGTGSDVELDLRIVESNVISIVNGDEARALAAAESALALARERGIDHPGAHYVVGKSRLEAGAPGWEEELSRAIELARRSGDLHTHTSAARDLAYGLLVTGRIERGLNLVRALADEARQLRLWGPERLFRVYLAGLHLHAGLPRVAADDLEEVLAEALEPTIGTPARFWLCEALVELGRFDEARPIVSAMLDSAPRDHHSFGSVLWAQTDLEFFSGRLREAVAAADECLRRFPGEGAAIFVKLSRGWAALELGLDLGEPMPKPYHAMAEAAPAEEQGVRALAAGEPARAAELLESAARLWRGRHSRGELRCLWGAGEAWRRAGEATAAVDQLLVAEQTAVEREAFAHLSRIQRSLRLAGVGRAASRSRDGVLTGREREVLALVADGLSNDEIAHRIGVGRPTVVRLIRTASVKLGAKNRAQAAVLARR